MKPPTTVKVGPFRYEIVDGPEFHEKARGDANCNGLTDFDHERIYVDPGLSPRMKRETIFHELLHTITDMVGLRSEADEDEELVRALAPALLATLLDNPDLARWLTSAAL